MSTSIVSLNSAVPLTIDTNKIISDNSMITVDTTETENLFFKIIPRKFIEEMKVIIYNELTEDKDELILNAVQKEGYAEVWYDDNYEFKENHSYEVKIVDPLDDSFIWRGKIFSTSTEDLQNFKFTERKNIIKI